MSDLAQLEKRVTRLERRMDEVHDLASRTGQEVADWRPTLKNHTKTLNAMNEKIDLFQTRVDGRFDKLESEMREGFTKTALGFAQINALLTTHLRESKGDG
jgi:hypothetical protein